MHVLFYISKIKSIYVCPPCEVITNINIYHIIYNWNKNMSNNYIGYFGISSLLLEET